jgi:hypothetical protein
MDRKSNALHEVHTCECSMSYRGTSRQHHARSRNGAALPRNLSERLSITVSNPDNDSWRLCILNSRSPLQLLWTSPREATPSAADARALR